MRMVCNFEEEISPITIQADASREICELKKALLMKVCLSVKRYEQQQNFCSICFSLSEDKGRDMKECEGIE